MQNFTGSNPSASSVQDASPALRRSNGFVGGVAGGLGLRLGIDPMLVRLAMIVVGFFTGPIAIAAYLAAWAFVPSDGTARPFNKKIVWAIAALVAVFVMDISPLWLLAGVAAWFYYRSRQSTTA